MVRKTKTEALATRCSLLDAAERLFLAHGVAGTSLQDIAAAAGLTRGAVYWHFKDKGDLFNAMFSRVCLPMEQTAAQLLPTPDRPALQTLREHLHGILERVANHEQVRRVFEIATHKVEYVDETSAVRERHLQMRRDHVAALERLLREAQARGEIAPSPPPRQIAIGLHALLGGLLQNWMLDPTSFSLRPVGRRAIEVHLAGLRAAPGLTLPAPPDRASAACPRRRRARP